MLRHRSVPLALVVLVLAAMACRGEFKTSSYPTMPALFSAGMAEFQRGNWDNAVTAFEKLTTDLPARDTLLPRSFWYLGRAHQHRDEWLLAASAFTRLVESFPDDSLSSHGALEAARSYRRLWRKPTLDPQYGETAVATYNTVLSLYAGSPVADTARRELGELDDWFAQKNYDTGVFYLRRNAYDSAIIYFKDILARWGSTATARLAGLRLVDAYRAIKYSEDVAETCATLRKGYAGDREVELACAGVATVAAPSTQAPTPNTRATPPPTAR